MNTVRYPLPAARGLVAALGGCATGRLSDGPSLPPGPPVGRPPAARRCAPAQLSVRGVDARGEAGGRTYVFTNVSGAACDLLGRPGFELRDGDGRRLPHQRCFTTTSTPGLPQDERPPSRAPLDPGAEASFRVVLGGPAPGGAARRCGVSSQAAVRMPDGTHVFRFPDAVRFCGEWIRVTPLAPHPAPAGG